MSDDLLERMEAHLTGWEHPAARLREALDYDHFRLFAQPILPLAAGGAAMAEVLVRLREEETRMLPPGDFLPAFEHYHMMPDLDRWVLRNALRHLGGATGAVRRLSINISGQTLEQPGFAPLVAMQLRLASVPPDAVVFEIDENDVLDRREAAERFALEVKGLGCGILVDGFARRAVSFEPLKALLADYAKVDGTLIRPILTRTSALTKLKAILRVGEVTGLRVIAECVESEEVKARLVELGVGYVQGFGIGRPEPIEKLLATS